MENLNLFIPLDIKIPTSMEDQFVYYYRYIDLFFGNREKKPNQINSNVKVALEAGG